MCMNTRKQGDVGLGTAIAYYTSCGISVSVPLTESQRYDLVIDRNGLQRVEVKTTTYKRHGKYVALLKTCGGNQSGAGKTSPFSSEDADILFICTPEGDYEIPAAEVGCVSSITLGESRQGYRVSHVLLGEEA